MQAQFTMDSFTFPTVLSRVVDGQLLTHEVIPWSLFAQAKDPEGFDLPPTVVIAPLQDRRRPTALLGPEARDDSAWDFEASFEESAPGRGWSQAKKEKFQDSLEGRGLKPQKRKRKGRNAQEKEEEELVSEEDHEGSHKKGTVEVADVAVAKKPASDRAEPYARDGDKENLDPA